MATQNLQQTVYLVFFCISLPIIIPFLSDIAYFARFSTIFNHYCSTTNKNKIFISFSLSSCCVSSLPLSSFFLYIFFLSFFFLPFFSFLSSLTPFLSSFYNLLSHTITTFSFPSFLLSVSTMEKTSLR